MCHASNLWEPLHIGMKESCCIKTDNRTYDLMCLSDGKSVWYHFYRQYLVVLKFATLSWAIIWKKWYRAYPEDKKAVEVEQPAVSLRLLAS